MWEQWLNVLHLTRREVIETYYLIIQIKQGFTKVGTDKPGATGDEYFNFCKHGFHELERITLIIKRDYADPSTDGFITRMLSPQGFKINRKGDDALNILPAGHSCLLLFIF